MEELLIKAQNGDSSAFCEAMLLIEKELYRIAKSNLNNEEDIIDAIQETTIAVYKNIHKLKNLQFFKTWVIRILINNCRKIYRSKAKKNVSFEENEVEKYVGREIDFSENIDFNILIRKLDNDEKNILTLFYCSNYTTKEISQILGKNENTIRSKMMRAKNKLKKDMEDNYERY